MEKRWEFLMSASEIQMKEQLLCQSYMNQGLKSLPVKRGDNFF
jgi:hypothetical protein